MRLALTSVFTVALCLLSCGKAQEGNSVAKGLPEVDAITAVRQAAFSNARAMTLADVGEIKNWRCNARNAGGYGDQQEDYSLRLGVDVEPGLVSISERASAGAIWKYTDKGRAAVVNGELRQLSSRMLHNHCISEQSSVYRLTAKGALIIEVAVRAGGDCTVHSQTMPSVASPSYYVNRYAYCTRSW